MTVTFAQDKYLSVMQKNIELVYKAGTPEEYQFAINALERVGNAEKTKWEPFYYSAFGYLMMATNEKDGAKKDQFLDLSAAALAKAKAINENESEIVGLEGFIQMIRVTVDPATRGPQYSGQAMQLYNKSLSLNADNPRTLGLMAQMQYGIASFFGSSTAEACATAAKSLEKFGTYSSPNPLAPVWGKGMAESMMKQCK
ncbi:MAG: hypothetical protein DI538_11340 [Azospira oryzae]|nr:MAG: hypothetical protein DI538_11340 [Azospira oryzae]